LGLDMDVAEAGYRRYLFTPFWGRLEVELVESCVLAHAFGRPGQGSTGVQPSVVPRF